MAYDPLLLPAGSLRHAIQIQAEAPGEQDAAGQPLDSSWTTILATRAAIRALRATEQFQNGAFTAQATHLVSIRYQPVTISPGMRILYGSRVYQIQSVNDVNERHRRIDMQVVSINEGSN